MAWNRSLVFLVIVLTVGCTDGGSDESPTEMPVASLAGVYSGVFPCAGCPGIPTTLWIRDDGSFFIGQEYPESDGREAMLAYNLGRWTWALEEQLLVLRGSGPKRVFERPDTDSLVMRSASDLEHRLSRDPAAPAFEATIRMTGLMRTSADGALFEECLSQIVAPVNRRGDYSRFLHQYRSAGAGGKPVYVDLDGRFSWSGDGEVRSLTIERFHTIREDNRC